MSNLKVGESGRVFYMHTGFDMSGFTRMRLTFVKPSGELMIRDSSASAVRLGTSAVFVTALSATLTANTYALYTFGEGSAGEVDESGKWKPRLDYWVSTDSPVTHLVTSRKNSAGDPFTLEVENTYVSASVSASTG